MGVPNVHSSFFFSQNLLLFNGSIFDGVDSTWKHNKRFNNETIGPSSCCVSRANQKKIQYYSVQTA